MSQNKKVGASKKLPSKITSCKKPKKPAPVTDVLKVHDALRETKKKGLIAASQKLNITFKAAEGKHRRTKGTSMVIKCSRTKRRPPFCALIVAFGIAHRPRARKVFERSKVYLMLANGCGATIVWTLVCVRRVMLPPATSWTSIKRHISWVSSKTRINPVLTSFL